MHGCLTDHIMLLVCVLGATLGPSRAGLAQMIWGFPKIRGYLFWDPHKKDYSILGSISGYP